MTAARQLDAPVVICGAGPVGMIVALELSSHGVRSVIVERNPTTTTFPKMDLTNTRSMELLGRLQLIDAVREVGVASHHESHVVFCSSLAGHEVGRWALPSVEQMDAQIATSNDGSVPKESWQRVSQEQLEPVLMGRCLADDLIEVMRPWEVVGVKQTENEATIAVRRPGSEELRTLRSSYVVGSDGAWSAVRTSLGIDLEGQRDVVTFAQVHFRSTDLAALHTYGPFWHLFFLGGGVGAIIAQDERETWTLHTVVSPDTRHGDLDPEQLLYKVCGRPVAVDKVLEHTVWRPNIVVAERFREGRSFIAGDAAHQVIPTGGYGLNTGIGDAIDIGWKLAAVLNGWGGPALLDSYDAERRPVAIANRDWSFRHLQIQMAAQELVDAELLDADTPAGDAHRADIAAFFQENRGENESSGIELGYRYAESPIVVGGAGGPTQDPLSYVPTTWPGSRAPHVRITGDRSLIDHFVDGFTLVDLCGAEDTGRLADAASELGVPFSVVEVDDAAARAVYETNLVLVRPDGHVAWRGNALPDDVLGLLKHVTGWSPSGSAYAGARPATNQQIHH